MSQSQRSAQYEEAIGDAQIEFRLMLPKDKIFLNRQQYEAGISALSEKHKAIIEDVRQWSIREKEYELSDEQVRIAFFGAVAALGLLHVS